MTAIDALTRALQYLDELCDGASSLDNHGFNGGDSTFGKSVASQSRTRPLSPLQLRKSYHMLIKYQHTQLEPAGIVLPPLEQLEAEIGVIEQAKNQAQASQAPGRIEMVNNKTLAITFLRRPFDTYLATVKAIPGRRWNLDKKWWEIPNNPATNAETFKLFPGFELTEDVVRLKQTAPAAKSETFIEPDTSAIVAERLRRMGDLTKPLPGGRVPFNHQRLGAEFLAKLPDPFAQGKKGGIIADKPGLGKTLTTLLATKAFGLPVFVIAPPALLVNWQREAEIARVQIEIFSWAKMPTPPERQKYVVIFDEAHLYQSWGVHTVDRKTKLPVVRGVRRTADMIRLALHDNCAAVFHATGTPMPNGRPVGLFPMLYSVRHPLANDKEWYEKHFCAKQQKTIGANSFWDVTGAAHLDELYYETQKGPHAAMILRTKEECLDLPPKIQVMRPVELSPKAQREFDHTLSELEKAYQERKENKRITLQQAIAKRLGELQEDYDEGQIDDEVLKEGMEEVGEMQSRLRNLDAADAVVMLGYICHAASLAKIEETKGFVEEIIGSGEQVGIFVRFRDVCHTLAGLFPNSETITSETPNAERQRIVDRFQAGQTRVIVCTFGAGGVGLTMTAASHAIMHDRPWTPGAVEQAEDRFHRIGSTKTVFSTWMQLPEADERIDDILQQKQERIDLALHGERKTMRGTKSVIAQAPMILDGIFSERKKR